MSQGYGPVISSEETRSSAMATAGIDQRTSHALAKATSATNRVMTARIVCTGMRDVSSV